MKSNETIPMQYPYVHKDVEGYKCPEVFYTSYDLTTKNCGHCGRPKHYKPCNYSDAQCCYGWGTDVLGPMSCEGYVKYQQDRKEFL